MQPTNLQTKTSATRPALRHGTARRDRRGGFTLVELLVVLVILSLVMGLVGPRVLNYLTSSRERAATLQIQSFAAALDLFFLDNGRYPSNAEGLRALVERPTSAPTWAGPYVQQSEIPADPWGNPYVYRQPGQAAPYVITSLGSDGQQGGEADAADISNE